MLERIGHIKNPLTVIAIFAGIAEVFGTIVLPFVDSEVQPQFVSFLTAFPFFLVFLFFVTLWWNHRVLYAPSDYREERNFMQHFVKQDDGTANVVSSLSVPELPEEPETKDLGGGEDTKNPATNSAEIHDQPSSSNSADEVRGDANKSSKTSRLDPYGVKIKPLLNTKLLTKHIIATEMSAEIGGKYNVNVSPKNFPNAKFDIVIQSPSEYWVVQVVEGAHQITGSLMAIRNIYNFYKTLSVEEQQRFAAKLVFIRTDDHGITEDERKKLVDMLSDLPYRVDVEERYPDRGLRRKIETS